MEPERLGHGEALVVACLLQHGHGVVEVARAIRSGGHRGVGPQQVEVGPDRHARRQPGVAELDGDAGRLGQQLLGGGDLAARDQRRRRASAASSIRSGASRGSRAFARPSSDAAAASVVALESGDTRAGEMLGGPSGQPVDAGAALSGLAPGAHGLVEVVAGVEIDVSVTLDRAPGEPLVELGAPPFGQAAVRDVADQAVPERPAGAAGIVGLAGTDELAPDEGQQRRSEDLPPRAPRPPPS